MQRPLRCGFRIGAERFLVEKRGVPMRTVQLCLQAEQGASIGSPDGTCVSGRDQASFPATLSPRSTVELDGWLAGLDGRLRIDAQLGLNG